MKLTLALFALFALALTVLAQVGQPICSAKLSGLGTGEASWYKVTARTGDYNMLLLNARGLSGAVAYEVVIGATKANPQGFYRQWVKTYDDGSFELKDKFQSVRLPIRPGVMIEVFDEKGNVVLEGVFEHIL